MKTLITALFLVLMATGAWARDHKAPPDPNASKVPVVCTTMMWDDFRARMFMGNPAVSEGGLTGQDRAVFLKGYNALSQHTKKLFDTDALTVHLFTLENVPTIYVVFAVDGCVARAGEIPIKIYLEMKQGGFNKKTGGGGSGVINGEFDI